MRTSKAFKARYSGKCAGCGTDIIAERSTIRMHEGDLYHDGCVPSGHPKLDIFGEEEDIRRGGEY